MAYAKREMQRTSVKTVLGKAGEETLSAEMIFNAGKAGDAFADGIAEKMAFYLGRGMAAVCAVVNPEKILIGGRRICRRGISEGKNRKTFQGAGLRRVQKYAGCSGGTRKSGGNCRSGLYDYFGTRIDREEKSL